MSKRLFLMAFVSLLAAATFSSCDKDKKDESSAIGEFTIRVANAGSIDADTIKMTVSTDSGTFVAVSVPYTGGDIITLKLSDAVGEEFLFTILDEIPDTSTITVSRRGVKGTFGEVVAYKSGSSKGKFYCATAEESAEWDGSLLYANSDVSVTGTYTEHSENEETTETWSVSLKKGWNIMYSKDTEAAGKLTREITSTAPAGIKWYYSAYER